MTFFLQRLANVCYGKRDVDPMKIHPLSKLVEIKGLHWGAPSKRKACIALEAGDEEAAPHANKKKTMIQHLALHNIPGCFTTHYLPIIEAQLVCYFQNIYFCTKSYAYASSTLPGRCRMCAN